ncbi:hypothetical protein QE388_001458 [Microbacterium sp. SORGH_AS 969]|nr:hypothetical protein [Microbacterium sp. SORGH_AS_0969]
MPKPWHPSPSSRRGASRLTRNARSLSLSKGPGASTGSAPSAPPGRAQREVPEPVEGTGGFDGLSPLRPPGLSPLRPKAPARCPQPFSASASFTRAPMRSSEFW